MNIRTSKSVAAVLITLATTAIGAHSSFAEKITPEVDRQVQLVTTDLPMRFEIDDIVKPAIKQEKGATVVAISNGATSAVYGYGRVSDNSNDAPTGETMFEIASLSKLFTALILADMANRGEVRLDDPVEQYMPGNVHIPTFDGVQITLGNLATYTSGLPRMPRDRKDAWSPFSTAVLYKTISTYKLNSRPGTKYEYSNLGYVLLGQALSNRADQSFDQLLKTRITGPLNMHHTVLRLTPAMEKRFALGHDRAGIAVPLSIPMGCGASGGIRSTANDMLKFLSAYIDPAKAPGALQAPIVQTLKPRVKNATTSIGLAWAISRNGFPQKTGLVSGYRSFIGFSPSKHIGVAVFTSSIAIDAPEIGREILSLLTNSDQKSAPED